MYKIRYLAIQGSYDHMVYAYMVSNIISCTCTFTFSDVIICAGIQQTVQFDMYACHSIGSQGMGGSSGGQGVRTPLKNHKNKGYLSNTGQEPLKNHKATKPAFNVRPSFK